MKSGTIAIAFSIILRIIATSYNCLIILFSGISLIGCVIESRSQAAFWLWPYGFAVIHLLAIWLPGPLIGTTLKTILRIIVTIIDLVLIPSALLLFVGLNMVETSMSQLIGTFFLVLLLPIGFAVINILAIWIPHLVSTSATPVR